MLAARAMRVGVVPSQTARLVSKSHKTRFDAHCAHLCGPVPNLKPLAHRFFTEEVNQLRTCLREVPPPVSGKVGNALLSDVLSCFILIDFLLSGYFCQSFYPMDVSICSIK